jgi:inner membrane transporter RhtA
MIAARTIERVPPHAWFVGSAVFHYLGPSFAVLLFASIAPLGVAWLRIASAGLVFAIWRRPWRVLAGLPRRDVISVLALGAVLATMNAVFYEAIARLPLATVGAIEFLGPIAIASLGMRTRRNLLALLLAGLGVVALTDVRLEGSLTGYAYAFANCALFVAYILLGHRIAGAAGIDLLAASMLVATILALPFGLGAARPAFSDPLLLAAAIGVGVCSSVIPYVFDQLAMRRMGRATFALMLSLLPATATVIGIVVLRQMPSTLDLLGIALVIAGVALHQPIRTAS